MTTGERMTWCQGCGGLFPDGVPQHHCVGRVQFAPYPADHRPGGTFVVPLLTEDRVRQIVREELERAHGVLSADDSKGEGTTHVIGSDLLRELADALAARCGTNAEEWPLIERARKCLDGVEGRKP